VCAGGVDKQRYSIHLATSDDGFAWERHPDNPMVVDGWEGRDPMVHRVGDRWALYYTATEPAEGGNHVVAAVLSDDLVHWSDRTTVLRDEMVGTHTGPCESPFVLERDGLWYLFTGPDMAGMVDAFEQAQPRGRQEMADLMSTLPAYRTTRVLVSDDPLHFSTADRAGTIDAHAAEVVEDEDGQLWVSHCGWGQGGVYLARLHLEP
jgi:beta-fructofuranosidase